MTARRSVLSNASWNLGSAVIPMVAAVFAVPILIHSLGTERFGLLTLAWLIVGYFGLFDFGLGRALTHSVSSRIDTSQERDIPAVIWTTLAVMALLGIVVGIFSIVVAFTIGPRLLNVPDDLKDEARWTIVVLALSIPFVVTTTAVRGTLEAYGKFRPLGVLRALVGTLNFIGPVCLLPLTHSVVAIVAILAVMRTANWIVQWRLCVPVAGVTASSFTIDRTLLPSILRTGGWMTVSNLISPLFRLIDRFLVASRISLADVSFYSTPFDALLRTLVLPESLSTVMFPTFASSSNAESSRAANLMKRALAVIFVLMFPVSLLTITFAEEALGIWLGAEFAETSTRLLQVFGVGILFSSLEQIPFVLIQGRGRPDLTAKLHLAEFPLYIIVLIVMVNQFGIVGAAAAWSCRVFVDFVALVFLANRLVAGRLLEQVRPMLGPALALMLMLPVAAANVSVPMKLVGAFVALVAFTLAAWSWILDYEERETITGLVARLRNREGSTISKAP